MSIIINSIKAALSIILTVLFMIVIISFFIGLVESAHSAEQADNSLNTHISCNILLDNGTFDHLGPITVSKSAQSHYVGAISVLSDVYGFTMLEVPEVYLRVEKDHKLKGFEVSEQECKEVLDKADNLKLSPYQRALYKGMIPSIKVQREVNQIQAF